jgi:hypothetical protein
MRIESLSICLLSRQEKLRFTLPVDSISAHRGGKLYTERSTLEKIHREIHAVFTIHFEACPGVAPVQFVCFDLRTYSSIRKQRFTATVESSGQQCHTKSEIGG